MVWVLILKLGFSFNLTFVRGSPAMESSLDFDAILDGLDQKKSAPTHEKICQEFLIFCDSSKPNEGILTLVMV